MELFWLEHKKLWRKKGKQEITGTSYEPWHYRYVGVDAAREIYERGICLEEYFEQ